MKLKCYKSFLKMYNATIDEDTFEVKIYDINTKEIVYEFFHATSFFQAECIINSQFRESEKYWVLEKYGRGTVLSGLLLGYVESDGEPEDVKRVNTFLFLLKKMEYSNKKKFDAKKYIDILEGYGFSIERGKNYLE